VFIKRTTKKIKGKTYTNYLLVESVATAKGPRHRIVCSLGSLSPAPREEWLALAHKIEAALSGQSELLPDSKVDAIVRQIKGQRASDQSPSVQPGASAIEGEGDLVAIHTDRIKILEAREAGSIHVGHQMWKRLGLDGILQEAGLSRRSRQLTEVMTLNRLIKPLSEHAMPGWIRRVAAKDVLGVDLDDLNHHALYRNLDRLHPQRVLIEKRLSQQERALFKLKKTILLYDLTSTYFEGKCLRNLQAKRGYSRDKRPDCKQVVVGLVLDEDWFPEAHEVFEGNRTDRTTVNSMLDALEKRTGKNEWATVVIDRGMAFDDNIQQIKSRKYHYIVASRQGERYAHFEEFEDDSGWEEVIRPPSPTNPWQKKSRVFIKRSVEGNCEVHILCVSEGRKEKDRAIREKHEERLLKDLQAFSACIAKGRLADEAKINQRIGRLKERYPRVARYYQIGYDPCTNKLTWQEDTEKKKKAEELDGGYLLKTDRKDLTPDEIWRTYILLTRVESAFRAMKSPLLERPIFHHVEERVQAHIFLCVLAYHLLVSIEKMFLDRGIHTSWETLRQQLSTHQVVTVALPASNGDTLKIRKGTNPEEVHQEIYRVLGIPQEVMKPVRIWCTDSH
jgi:transposase